MAKPATGTASGFIGSTPSNITSYATTSIMGPLANELRRTLNRSHGSRRRKATLLAITGAAAGAASKAYSNSRIDAGVSTGQAGRNDLGGKRTIETKTYQTGNSVAADITDFDTVLQKTSKPSTYPVDKGGGRTVGYVNRLA